MQLRERTVWVVDDVAIEAERARAALSCTFGTRTFRDGSEVLEALASSAVPDVLILDMVMPGVSGVDVCRFIRQQQGPASRVGILVVAGDRSPAIVAQGLAAGANDYLGKPFAEQELRARVVSLIRLKELLESVESAETRVRRLLAQVPDVLLVVDAHGRVTYANEEGRRVLGQPAAALVGKPLGELIPELELHRLDPRAGPTVELPDVAIGGETYSPLVRLARGDFAASTTIVLRNVTERRRLEARRLDFYSIIAHDLRSPLAAMLLRTDILLNGGRGALPAQVIGDVRRIESNVRSMVGLINDFLDLARLESGGYKLERLDVDFAALVAATVEDLRPLAEAGRLSLDLEMEPTPLVLAGDRHRLVQVLTNLLSNAVKFTPAGGRITVTLRRAGPVIELEVSDTGHGIPPEAIPRLFERYTRASDRTSVGGTGLGLMIVREIVEAHGGTVGVDSRVGEGATFTVRLPAFDPERDQEGRRGQHVLVVDDDEDLRESLQHLLESAGYSVDTAADGREALAMLTEGHAPSLVVLDVNMPVMTGPELLAAMRKQERLARLPVCVMSGDLSALRAAPPGALVMQKPIQVDRLLEFVGRVMPRERQRAPETP